MKAKTREWLNTAPSLLWLVGLVLVPVLIVFVIAFRPALPAGGIGPGWSFAAVRALADPVYLELLLNTVVISAVTTLLCITMALPVAFAMARLAPRWRARVLLLVIVPFWTNFVIRVFAWQQILHAQGVLAEALRWTGLLGENDRLLGNFAAVVVVSVYTYLPFAILPLFAAAEKFDFHLLDAARDLGARPLRAFVAVFVPGIRQGLVTALLVVFIPMLGSYVVPDMVGGTGTQMLGNKIAQRNFNDRNLPEAAALSGALTLLVLAPLLLRRKDPATVEPEPKANSLTAMRPSRLPFIALCLVLAFFYLPIGFLVMNSFNASRFSSRWGGFSTRWYERLTERADILAALANSVKVACAASLTAMVLGTAAALVLHRHRTRLQRFHGMLVTVPLVLPDILMGMSLLLLFVSLGVTLNLVTVAVAHVTFCLSYVALVVQARLQDFDLTMVEAARDLGASRFQAFRKITLPLLAPGILAGGLLAFTLSIDDYVITYFVKGPGADTLPTLVYSMIKKSRDLPVINALSTIMLVATFVVVAISQRLIRPVR